MRAIEKLFGKRYFCTGCNTMHYAEDMKYTVKGTGLCGRCIKNMKFTKRNDTFAGPDNIDFVVSPLFYIGTTAILIRDLKFKNVRRNADILKEIVSEYIKEFDIFDSYDVIIPVPLSKERYNERGFNQSEYAARALGESTGIPVNTEALKRIRNTKRQSRVCGMERELNVKGAFKAEKTVKGLSVILVDDIYTTGNTLKACAAAINAEGADKICAFTYSVRELQSEGRIYGY